MRVESDGERVPLTIADADANEGWIELIVQAAGHTTQKMSQLKEGDVILDLVGPLGHPTEIKNMVDVFVWVEVLVLLLYIPL